MTEESFQGKYITWRTRRGSIDVLLISAILAVLLIIPLFQFIVSTFSTLNRIDKAEEVLEIASISTYTKLNQDSLGSGILEIDETLALSIFNQQIDELITNDASLSNMSDAEILIAETDEGISIESKAVILSAFNQSIQVENSLEFIIDPIMEDFE